jgi:hypothetical protein
MSKSMLRARWSAVAAFALSAGLAACGGSSSSVAAGSGSSSGASTGSSSGSSVGNVLPIFSGITSCLTQTGVTNALQTQLLNALAPALTSNGSTTAAGLTSVLSSFLNVSNLLTSGLQNLNSSGSASGFATSLAGATSSLNCGVQLLSNTLNTALSSVPGAGSNAQVAQVGSDITALVNQLTLLSGQLNTGGSKVSLSTLTAELTALSNDLPGLSTLLGQVPSQGTTITTLLPYLAGGFGNLSSIFGQLGNLNGSGLSAALPTLLSDLTSLFSSGTIAQLGVPSSLSGTLTTALNQVLGNQTTILSGLNTLLTTLLSVLLGGLL